MKKYLLILMLFLSGCDSSQISSIDEPGQVEDVWDRPSRLTWEAPLDGGPVEHYDVYWEDSETEYSIQVPRDQLEISLSDLDLDSGESYDLWVTASNSAGEGPISNIVTIDWEE
jgi:hypothetical protein